MRHTRIYRNQGWRDATWLATLADGRQLYEYGMPNGTTTLIELKDCPECKGTGKIRGTHRCSFWGCWATGYVVLRTIPYATLPVYWIKAIVEAGNENNLEFWPQQAWRKGQIESKRARYNRIVKEVLDG